MKHTDLDVQFDSYKPIAINIVEFDDKTHNADFSLSMDYKTKEILLRVLEYNDNHYAKYTSIEFGTAPDMLKIVFKEDNCFPDFSYEQNSIIHTF